MDGLMSIAISVRDSIWGLTTNLESITLDDPGARALHEHSGDGALLAIFPWGTGAVFNRFQIPLLVRQWEAAISATSDPDVRANLQAVLAFIATRVKPDVDNYVVAVAD